MYDAVQFDFRPTEIVSEAPPSLMSDSLECGPPPKEVAADHSVVDKAVPDPFDLWLCDYNKRIVSVCAWAAKTHSPPSNDLRLELDPENSTLATALDTLAAIGSPDGIQNVAIGLLQNVQGGKHKLCVVTRPLTDQDKQRLQQFYVDVMEAVRHVCEHRAGPSYTDHVNHLSGVIARQSRADNDEFVHEARASLVRLARSNRLREDLLRGFDIEVIQPYSSDPAAADGAPVPTFELWAPRIRQTIASGKHSFQNIYSRINWDDVNIYVRERLKCLGTASEQSDYPKTVHPVISILLHLHAHQSVSHKAWNYIGSSNLLCWACWNFIKLYGTESWTRIKNLTAKGTDYRWENWAFPNANDTGLEPGVHGFNQLVGHMHSRSCHALARSVRLHMSNIHEVDDVLPACSRALI